MMTSTVGMATRKIVSLIHHHSTLLLYGLGVWHDCALICCILVQLAKGTQNLTPKAPSSAHYTLRSTTEQEVFKSLGCKHLQIKQCTSKSSSLCKRKTWRVYGPKLNLRN